MRKIGYARVSSTHQSLDRQLGALRAERVDAIYREKASGKTTKDRPELAKAIDALGKGDIRASTPAVLSSRYWTNPTST